MSARYQYDRERLLQVTHRLRLHRQLILKMPDPRTKLIDFNRELLTARIQRLGIANVN